VELLFIERLSAQPKADRLSRGRTSSDEFEAGDLSSVRPLDQGKMIAARAAASSFVTPRANDATELARARSIQDDRPVAALLTALAA
jgi:hypothetical protein